VPAGQLGQHQVAAVTRAVVHEDDLERRADSAHDRQHLADEFLK
jgi:hypothetical protein